MVIQMQKEIKPKEYEFSDAYKKALEDDRFIRFYYTRRI